MYHIKITIFGEIYMTSQTNLLKGFIYPAIMCVSLWHLDTLNAATQHPTSFNQAMERNNITAMHHLAERGLHISPKLIKSALIEPQSDHIRDEAFRILNHFYPDDVKKNINSDMIKSIIIDRQSDHIINEALKILNHFYPNEVKQIINQDPVYLNIACSNNYVNVLKTLINCTEEVKSKIESIRIRHFNNTTVGLLYRAMIRENKEIVDILVENGAQWDNMNDMMAIVRERDFKNEYLKTALKNGLKVNQKDEYNNNLMHHVIAYQLQQKNNTINILVDHGIDINAENKYKRTPLHEAAFMGDPAIVQLLCENGANKTVQNSRGQTAFDIAIECGHTACANILNN